MTKKEAKKGKDEAKKLGITDRTVEDDIEISWEDEEKLSGEDFFPESEPYFHWPPSF